MNLKAEIFAVGKWNGFEFSLEDLESIAQTFNRLGDNHQVPLKFGHNNEQPVTDGQPALGWVDKVWVEGNKLMAEFIDIPTVVFNAIEGKLYKNVSVELDFGVEYKGDFLTYVLSGVALLGADIPAVNTLTDLTAYMGRQPQQQVQFTNVSKRLNFNVSLGEDDMSLSETEIAELKTKVETLGQQVTDLNTEKANFAAEKTALQSQLDTLNAEQETAKFSAAKTGLESRLESLVKAQVIQPAQREQFMAKWKDDKVVVDALVFSVEALEAAMPTANQDDSPNTESQAQSAATTPDGEEGQTADAILFSRIRTLRNTNQTLSFSAAKRQVLEGDAVLAKDYIAISGGV